VQDYRPTKLLVIWRPNHTSDRYARTDCVREVESQVETQPCPACQAWWDYSLSKQTMLRRNIHVARPMVSDIDLNEKAWYNGKASPPWNGYSTGFFTPSRLGRPLSGRWKPTTWSTWQTWSTILDKKDHLMLHSAGWILGMSQGRHRYNSHPLRINHLIAGQHRVSLNPPGVSLSEQASCRHHYKQHS